VAAGEVAGGELAERRALGLAARLGQAAAGASAPGRVSGRDHIRRRRWLCEKAAMSMTV
jgi:hypothetical protein